MVGHSPCRAYSRDASHRLTRKIQFLTDRIIYFRGANFDANKCPPINRAQRRGPNLPISQPCHSSPTLAHWCGSRDALVCLRHVDDSYLGQSEEFWSDDVIRFGPLHDVVRSSLYSRTVVLFQSTYSRAPCLVHELPDPRRIHYLLRARFKGPSFISEASALNPERHKCCTPPLVVFTCTANGRAPCRIVATASMLYTARRRNKGRLLSLLLCAVDQIFLSHP